MSTTFDINARDFFRAIDAVKPHAGSDDTLPVINQIHLEIADGHLLFVATNRFTLAVSRIPAETADAATVDVGLDDINRIGRTFRPSNRRLSPVVRLTFDGSLTVEDAPTMEGMPTTRVVTAERTGTFPGWRNILTPPKPDAESAGYLAFNPIYLALFAHAQQGAEPMHVTVGTTGGLTRVQFGDHFTGAIMPVRATEVPAWWVTEPKAEPATASTKPARKPRARKAAAA